MLEKIEKEIREMEREKERERERKSAGERKTKIRIVYCNDNQQTK